MLADAAIAVDAADSATQVVFRVPGTVRLDTGQTLVIPIVSRELAVERLSNWDVAGGGARPLATARVKNETGSSLPPGILSLFERGPTRETMYVGDARLGALPAGESRLVGYAVDDRMQAAREDSAGERIAAGRISRGVLQLDVVDQRTTRYRLRAPAGEARTVVIEQPRLPGWRVAAPAEREVEQTPAGFRVRANLAAGESRTLDVVQEITRESRVALIDTAPDALLAYARNTTLSERLRRALESVAALKQDVTRAEQPLKTLETERARMVAEQSRVRDNLAWVPSSSDLHKRYLDLLRQHEDQFQALAGQIAEAQARVAAARERLADAIAKLEV